MEIAKAKQNRLEGERWKREQMDGVKDGSRGGVASQKQSIEQPPLLICQK